MDIVRAVKTVVREPKTYVVRWLKNVYLQSRNPEMTMHFPIIWSYDNYDAIKIGAGVFIGAFSEITVVENSPNSKITGRLIIEERAVIGAAANIRAAGGEIYIGRNSLIANNVCLVASNHAISNEQPYRDLGWDESKTGVFIDENVWMGAGVTVLPGCTIGKNSVIGAGSVIAKSVPPNEVWAGVPARKIRSIPEDSSTKT